MSYAGKNAYSAGKTSEILRGGASGDNRCYVLAHCGGAPHIPILTTPALAEFGTTKQSSVLI